MILAGDVGGTKAVLALVDPTGGSAPRPTGEAGRVPTPHSLASLAGPALRVVRDATYRCAEYPSLEAILDVFRGGEPITSACFGVAGPVIDGVAKITNLPWTIASRAVSERLGGIPVSLLNDLQATALGTLVLPDTAFAVLQVPATPPGAGATIGVVAPGTGLGESVLVHDGARYRALPSEGGHADFAPSTDEEIELLRFLRERHAGHVSWERVLSGGGIGNLYDFARRATGEPEPAWLAEQIAAGDRNAAISGAGLARRDAACVHALELFAALLGAEAGNLALRMFATGGVVIGGGIPPKLLPALQTGATIARFNDKGRFRPWARALGVRVVLEPRAALYGAAHEASITKDHPS